VVGVFEMMTFSRAWIGMIAILPIVLMMVIPTTASIRATNESSYQFGYQTGALSDSYPEFENGITCGLVPSYKLNNGTVMPGVTNTTACQNGWFSGLLLEPSPS
jgi:hypothetical protein